MQIVCLNLVHWVHMEILMNVNVLRIVFCCRCRDKLGLEHTGLPLHLLHEEPPQTGETRRPRQELQVNRCTTVEPL